jgi:hypothetical protein
VIWHILLVIETIWLATIYGHRAFDAWDRYIARFQQILEDDLDERP